MISPRTRTSTRYNHQAFQSQPCRGLPGGQSMYMASLASASASACVADSRAALTAASWASTSSAASSRASRAMRRNSLSLDSSSGRHATVAGRFSEPSSSCDKVIDRAGGGKRRQLLVPVAAAWGGVATEEGEAREKLESTSTLAR
jgi:hypothetical protein